MVFFRNFRFFGITTNLQEVLKNVLLFSGIFNIKKYFIKVCLQRTIDLDAKFYTDGYPSPQKRILMVT